MKQKTKMLEAPRVTYSHFSLRTPILVAAELAIVDDQPPEMKVRFFKGRSDENATLGQEKRDKAWLGA